MIATFVKSAYNAAAMPLLTAITLAAAAAAFAALCGAPSVAQETTRTIGPAAAGAPPPASGAPSPFLIEPDAQIKGDKIKRETFRSQPAGQNRNWNLDIGRFQPPINEDPNQLADDLEGNYSGMRLRLPLRGGLGQ